MKHLFIMAFATAVTTAMALPAAASPLYLYDGTQAGTPDTQGWLESLDSGGSQTAGSGYTTVDTTDDVGSLFLYYNHDLNTGNLVNSNFPTLNNAQGYTVSFTGNMVKESHGTNPGTTDSNAGWSLLVTSSNQQGIQIAFQDNLIYSLNSSLLEDTGNTATFNNVGSHTYDLHVINNTYALTVDNQPTPILTGSTMDFSSIPPPYGDSNLVLLGDTSTTADTNYQLSSVTVTIPEPAVLCGLVMGLYALTRRRRTA